MFLSFVSPNAPFPMRRSSADHTKEDRHEVSGTPIVRLGTPRDSYGFRTPAFSSAFQKGSRSSRFSTLPGPDTGSDVLRNSTERGHL